MDLCQMGYFNTKNKVLLFALRCFNAYHIYNELLLYTSSKNVTATSWNTNKVKKMIYLKPRPQFPSTEKIYSLALNETNKLNFIPQQKQPLLIRFKKPFYAFCYGQFKIPLKVFRVLGKLIAQVETTSHFKCEVPDSYGKCWIDHDFLLY